MADEGSIDRKALRKQLLEARLALDEATHRRFSEAITTALLAYLSPLGNRALAFYWPYRQEYDPLPIAHRIAAEDGVLALPVIVEKGRPLEFRPWHPDIEMLVGLYEIPHPAGDVAIEPEIILAPTVGFDLAGYRLGYGSGYYDRTIAGLAKRATVIGVGFELGRVDTIDPQPHDVPMDLIVTEGGVFRPVDGALTRVA